MLKGAEQKKGSHAVQRMLLVKCGIMFVSLDLPLKLKCRICIFFGHAHESITVLTLCSSGLVLRESLSE